MARQLDLFSAQHAAFDSAFGSLGRSLLAEGAWIDYAPGWVTGHDALFDQLASSLAWRTETRRMYDQRS